MVERKVPVGLIFLVLWLMPFAAGAFYIRLSGIVTEHSTGHPMKGVQVRLVKDSVERATVITGWNGRYELFLERGYDHLVWFHRPDLVTKHVRIDARDIPLHPDVPFYDMDLQMTLFTWIDGFDFSVFDEPVGVAEYKHSVRNLNWDISYTQQRRQVVARVMVDYQRALEERRRTGAGVPVAPARQGRKRARF